MTTSRVTGARTLGDRTLHAYLVRNGRLFMKYAYLVTGSEADAKAITKDFSIELGRNWDHTLRQAAYDAYAWRLLKEHVVRWLEEHGKEPLVAETAIRKRVLLVQLGYLKQWLATWESDLGLYQAVAKLSERRCDVMILRFVLNQEIEDIAGFLGIDTGTVYSTINQARDALMRNPAVRSMIRPVYRPADPPTPSTPDAGSE